jgi:hypothetical protein
VDSSHIEYLSFGDSWLKIEESYTKNILLSY